MIVGGSGWLPTAGTSGAGSAAPTTAAAVSSPGVVGAGSGTSAALVNGTFYGVNDSVNPVAKNHALCGFAGFSSYSFLNEVVNQTIHACASGAQNPSLVNLANGKVGVGYSVLTNLTTSTCPGAQNHTLSTVDFRVSANDGTTFGPAVQISNSTCDYLQSIEPAFATGPKGQVDSAFVEENQNNFSLWNLSMNYINRSADALGFTVSDNNGSSFQPVRTILAGSNIARPQIATFGQSIYILYYGINNSTTNPLPASPLSVGSSSLPPTYPVTLRMIYSKDNGATWSTPITMPGLNKAYNYSVSSASMAVNATGVVGVVYATNLSCAEFVYYSFSGSTYCEAYGYQLVSTSSSTNGTSWTPLSLIAGPTEVGEVLCGQYTTAAGINFDCYGSPFQWGPYVSFEWGASNPSTMYVAWSGAYIYDTNGTIYVPQSREGSNETGANATAATYYYGDAGLFSGVSSNAGHSWNTTVVVAPTPPGGMGDYYVSPSLAQGNGKLYLTYGVQNNTYCYGGSCSLFSDAYAYYIATGTGGLHWDSPVFVIYAPGAYFYGMEGSWAGYNTASTVDSNHLAVSAFALPQPTLSSFAYNYHFVGGIYYINYFYNYSSSDNLTVAHSWGGVIHPITYQEVGLPTNKTWSISLSGTTFSTNRSSITVQNFPNNTGILFSTHALPAGFWTQYEAVSPTPGFYAYNQTQTVNVTYEAFYGIEFYYNPQSVQSAVISLTVGSTTYNYQHYSGPGYVYNYASPAFPWYFANGTALTLDAANVSALAPVSYFSGTGRGSVNATGATATVHTDGPINETVWFGAFGVYNVTFVPRGLSNGLSYSFRFNGQTYSAVSPKNVTVNDVSTGYYSISDLQANSSTPGWMYFGQASANGLLDVPASPYVDLNFSYAYVDVAATPGTVSFHASQLRGGDVWRIAFNGTSLSSTTPWINITAHPGTYQVTAYPVEASANNTVAYTPVNLLPGTLLSVTPGTTYNLTYALSYHVMAMGAFGGSVSGLANGWAAPGTVLHYSASPHANYRFGGWKGVGAGSYTGANTTMNVTVGGPITETAAFTALPTNRFNLTFDQTGIPNGTYWSVQVGTQGYSSDQPTLVVPDLYSCSAGSAGQYAIAVPDAYLNSSVSSGTRWVPGTVPSSTCTSGFTVVPIKYTTQYLVNVIAGNGGSAALTLNGITTAQPTWANGLATVSLVAQPSPGYAFAGWVGTGTGSYSGPSQIISIFPGSPISEVASFAAIVIPPPPRYVVELHDLSPLAAGTSWSITWEGVGYTSLTPWINVTNLLSGTYSLGVQTVLSPDGSTQYVPQFSQKAISVNSNSTVGISFSTSYHVVIQSTPGGNITSPATSDSFVLSGTSLLLNATPLKGDYFVGWVGTGSGSYTGSSPNWTVVVSSPISEVATFAKLPPPASTSGFLSSVSSPPAIAGLAVVGLIVGLVVGLLVFRRRKATPPSPPNPSNSVPPASPSPKGGKP